MRAGLSTGLSVFARKHLRIEGAINKIDGVLVRQTSEVGGWGGTLLS